MINSKYINIQDFLKGTLQFRRYPDNYQEAMGTDDYDFLYSLSREGIKVVTVSGFSGQKRNRKHFRKNTGSNTTK